MNSLKTFFYSFKKSLFELKYYKDIEKVSFWFSFKYLWFLLFIFTLIKTFTFIGLYLKNRPRIQMKVNRIMIYAENFYPKELKLDIKNGQLSTNTIEPFFFDPDQRITADLRRHFLIIDTKGSIENYPSYNTYILATKNAVVYPSESKNNKIGETSVFYFRELKKDFTLDKKTYDNLLNIVKPYTSKINFFVDWIVLSFSPLFIIFGSFFWTIGVMTVILFLTFFIWIINLMFKKGLSYGSLYKMGMHAITWPILTSELMGYIKPPYPKFYSLIFLIWMLIILFQKSTSKKRA